MPGLLLLDREQRVIHYPATGSWAALIAKCFLESLAIFRGSWSLQEDQCEEISSPLLMRAKHCVSQVRDADRCCTRGLHIACGAVDLVSRKSRHRPCTSSSLGQPLALVTQRVLPPIPLYKASSTSLLQEQTLMVPAPGAEHHLIQLAAPISNQEESSVSQSSSHCFPDSVSLSNRR